MTFAIMSLTMSANSIMYFTHSQANRCVKFLNAQDEMMIYCGYDNEIETYVIISDIWAERATSRYYELWVFGYDAYTGEEIYMPLDLGCVWLHNRYSGRLYSAAQYLRFRSTAKVPTIFWCMPAYNHFTRTVHVTHYVRTYHYDIHRPGWVPPMPPAPHHGEPHHGAPAPHPNTPVIHPYYLRTPGSPAPTITSEPFTPGQTRPTIAPNNGSSRPSDNPTITTGNVRPTTTPTSGSSRPGASNATATSTRPTTTATTTTTNSRPGNTTTSTTTTSTRPTNNSTGTTNTSTSRPTSNTNKTTTTTTRPASTTTTSSNSRPAASAAKTTTTTTTRPAATTTTTSRPSSTTTKTSTTTTSNTRPTSTTTRPTTTTTSNARPTSK